MALNIKNQNVENLLDQVVQLTGESKTEAVKKALEERRQRLSIRFVGAQDEARLLAFLEDEIWPKVPTDMLGTKLSKSEEAEILGYGEAGV